MKALDAKLVRDLWRMRGQAVAIAVVLAAATATFVLSMGVHRSLTETRDAYYARNLFADVFASMTRAPESIVDEIAAIPGVGQAEGSIQQFATLDLPGRVEPVRALINSLDDQGPGRLNRLTLRSGSLPRSGEPRDVVVDEAFASANDLMPGAEFAVIIQGKRQWLRVVGTGLAPNFIYALAPGDLIPEEKRFGILWMGRDALEAATDRTGAINTVALTLGRDASETQVIRDLDALLAPFGGTGAYGRKDHVSDAFLANELMQLEAMTKVIPPVFLLVAAFLVYIVLGRMIRTERTQIGLLKAFGYSDREVALHYLKFAMVIAIAGAMLGSAAGVWMGRSMTLLYAQYYHFPFLEYRMAPSVFAVAVLLAAGTAAIGALAGMRGALRLSPAVAMAPPAPPMYRRGLVERLGEAAGLSTVGAMIVRHIARWPVRSAVTVFGIALSLALLFATLQFVDASRSLLDAYFFRAQRQDITVSFVEPRNEAALHALARLPGVLRVEPSRTVPVELSNRGRNERAAIEASAPGTLLARHIDASGHTVAPPVGGLMLSRQLATKLGVAPGDSITVELLGGRRTRADWPVTRVIDEFVGERAYASLSTLERLTRDASPAGAALLKIDPAQRRAVLAALEEMPLVLGVTERDAALSKFEQIIEDNMLTMLGFYIAFASAIAVGVVYNSARILFSERAHELATLRVLGYHRTEVGLIILGELALLVVAAVPIGCILGYWMGQLMTAMFSSDLFRLPFAPTRASYGWSVMIVLVAAGATAIVVARRVFALDMVRVLKARE